MSNQLNLPQLGHDGLLNVALWTKTAISKTFKYKKWRGLNTVVSWLKCMYASMICTWQKGHVILDTGLICCVYCSKIEFLWVFVSCQRKLFQKYRFRRCTYIWSEGVPTSVCAAVCCKCTDKLLNQLYWISTSNDVLTISKLINIKYTKTCVLVHFCSACGGKIHQS